MIYPHIIARRSFERGSRSFMQVVSVVRAGPVMVVRVEGPSPWPSRPCCRRHGKRRGRQPRRNGTRQWVGSKCCLPCRYLVILGFVCNQLALEARPQRQLDCCIAQTAFSDGFVEMTQYKLWLGIVVIQRVVIERGGVNSDHARALWRVRRTRANTGLRESRVMRSLSRFCWIRRLLGDQMRSMYHHHQSSPHLLRTGCSGEEEAGA